MSTAPTRTTRTAPAMSLLSHGVPLTLLLDLALGPHSRDLMAAERTVPVQRPPAA